MQVVEVVLPTTTTPMMMMMMMMNAFLFTCHFNLNFRNMRRMCSCPFETDHFDRFLCFLILF